MKKKFVISSIMVLPLILILIGYGYYNLKSNSVYYAKNTPHKEGAEPVLMMLIDNLGWIYNPDIDGIKYDFDGEPAIQMFDSKDEQIGFITSANIHEKSGYLFQNIRTGTMYEFDYKFKMEKVYNSSDSIYEIEATTFNERDVKNDIHEILKTLIDRQTKPLINLQWIFDRVYRDKFN
ncbi:MAG: hypothetical protein PUK21_07450 [Peptostreptococcaceae bacterium]|nr:hypothetical protein [Peptostreptococcaceae bacterium]